MAEQAFYSGLPWKIYRNRSGWPRWWQRWYEAWLVVTGRYTFWHAFDQGKHRGSMQEYRRIIGNGGDLGPIIDAAIYVTAAEIIDKSAHPQAEILDGLRAKAWARFKERPNALVGRRCTPSKENADG